MKLNNKVVITTIIILLIQCFNIRAQKTGINNTFSNKEKLLCSSKWLLVQKTSPNFNKPTGNYSDVYETEVINYNQNNQLKEILLLRGNYTFSIKSFNEKDSNIISNGNWSVNQTLNELILHLNYSSSKNSLIGDKGITKWRITLLNESNLHLFFLTRSGQIEKKYIAIKE